MGGRSGPSGISARHDFVKTSPPLSRLSLAVDTWYPTGPAQGVAGHFAPRPPPLPESANGSWPCCCLVSADPLTAMRSGTQPDVTQIIILAVVVLVGARLAETTRSVPRKVGGSNRGRASPETRLLVSPVNRAAPVSGARHARQKPVEGASVREPPVVRHRRPQSIVSVVADPTVRCSRERQVRTAALLPATAGLLDRIDVLVAAAPIFFLGLVAAGLTG